MLRDAVSRASIEVYRKLLADAHLEDTAYKQCHLSHDMHRQAASQEKKVVFPLASADACYVSAYSMMKCKELFGLQSFASSMLTSAQRSFANRYPSTDFNFWVQYGSWSCCSHCGSFFFNDEYFRNKVYRDAATSEMPDLLSTVRRQVPSDPVEHEDGSVGVSSRWWYLAGMYKPSAHCGRCIQVPKPQGGARVSAGKTFAQKLRAQTKLQALAKEMGKCLTVFPVLKTGELYKIPRIYKQYDLSDQVSESCITWPRYSPADGFVHNVDGDSMLDLSKEDWQSLQIVCLRTQVQREQYGGSHQLNWKQVGLSRAFFKKELVNEASLPSHRAQAAFRYLYDHNKHYKKFWEYHQTRLKMKASLNISSYHLFVHSDYNGIECAMFPHLYPTTEFSDTGRLSMYRQESPDDTLRVFSIGYSYTRKVLSGVRVYGEQRDLPFFLYEKHMATKFFAAQTLAKRKGLTGDVMARDSQASVGYWEIVRDALADLVRIMLARSYDQEKYPQLYNHCKGLRGEVWQCAFPNLFITIAPAEWKFPRPYLLESYLQCIFAGAYIMSLHMYFLVRSVWYFLANRFGHKFFIVYEWCNKTEYQGRGTPHWHLAAWVVSHGLLTWLQGRTGTAVVSAFVRFLNLLFHCEIDVQIGNGRLNYINGYVSKDHDAVDVGLGEYVQKDACGSWLATYRLISKSTPCIPEVAIRMAQLPEFDRSYTHVLLYPPRPVDMVEYQGRRDNFSTRMYGFYIHEKRSQVAAGIPVSENFLVWHRSREYDNENQCLRYRGGQHNQGNAKTQVVACRYWYELTDGFWGQFSITNLPHGHASHLLPRGMQCLESMQNFVGMLQYLTSWKWHTDSGIVEALDGFIFRVDALPLVVGNDGAIAALGSKYVASQLVFASDREAFLYLMKLAKRDLQYRGFRDDRLRCFELKQDANFLLYRRVLQCRDPSEYELLRQSWDTVNRPKYSEKKWSPEQQEAIDLAKQGVSYEDEETRVNSRRWLYIEGAPGSGKSAVLLELAIWACQIMQVLIVCPTGNLVHQYKSKLPDRDGIENIRVDTIQGVLNYKRPGADSKVTWSPPSALRRIDLILFDEGSQYEDEPWQRVFQCIREQPHSPFGVVVADFQQLQPIGAGGLCQRQCSCMQSVKLKTVYRSRDEEHLLFLNRIREEQPEKVVLRRYFAERHWQRESMETCVARGMELAKIAGEPFSWLTCTNSGASDVCTAALSVLGISLSDVASGFLCDPSAKSDLRILARKGVIIRLSRNFDKMRGFVNGALAEIEEPLRGNAVFTARLIGTGNMVLVHPMEEDGAVFLPCCYGYATTIRRAQGADLYHGCIYMDLKHRAAARGYGYVAASRFKLRSGCYLYGKLRRTDFLPVGEENGNEVLERGYSSLSSDDSEGAGLEHAFSEDDDESDHEYIFGEADSNNLVACDFE